MSNNVTVEIENLSISSDKVSFEVCSGESSHSERTVTFSPISADVSYSFSLNHSPIPGTFADFFSIVPDRSLTLNDDAPVGIYDIEIIGHLAQFGCTDQISIEIINVDCSTQCDDLQIVSFGGDVAVEEGGSATFTVDAIGSNVAYQWQEFINDAYENLAGENGTSLSFGSVDLSDNGRMFRVVITDDKGCLVTSPKATLTVTPLPDLTPILKVLPSTVIGVTCDIEVTAKIVELKGVATSGEIKVLIPKDPRLTFTYNGGMATIGAFNTPIDNADWTYNPGNFLFHEFTSNTVIPANGSSTIGFLACYDPQNTKGSATTTVQIVEGSGGEIRFDNNTDAEVLEYTFEN